VRATSDVVARDDLFSEHFDLLGRDGLVDDIQARGFDASVFSNLNKGTQALGARRNPLGFGAKEAVAIVKGLSHFFSRDDVDDFVQGIARRDVSSPHGARSGLDDFFSQHFGFLKPDGLADDVQARDLEDAFLQAIS